MAVRTFFQAKSLRYCNQLSDEFEGHLFLDVVALAYFLVPGIEISVEA